MKKLIGFKHSYLCFITSLASPFSKTKKSKGINKNVESNEK